MPLSKIGKRTWEQVKAEARAERIAYGRELLAENESGKSLRQIAKERNTSHQNVKNLIREAQEADQKG